MMYLRRMFPFTVVLLLAMAVAACGGSTSTGSSSTPAPTATAATTPTPSALVQTATATVKGQSKTILTDAQGKTLYYFTPDTATTSACTSACAQAWPPLLATGTGAPTSATTLSGKLTAVTTGNGNQVEYNGHLLYTFSGDTAPGKTTGEGTYSGTISVPVETEKTVAQYRGYARMTVYKTAEVSGKQIAQQIGDFSRFFEPSPGGLGVIHDLKTDDPDRRVLEDSLKLITSEVAPKAVRK